MSVVFYVIFCLFVLNLLGFRWVGELSRVVEIECEIGLFCCGFWVDFECEFG